MYGRSILSDAVVRVPVNCGVIRVLIIDSGAFLPARASPHSLPSVALHGCVLFWCGVAQCVMQVAIKAVAAAALKPRPRAAR